MGKLLVIVAAILLQPHITCAECNNGQENALNVNDALISPQPYKGSVKILGIVASPDI